MFCMNCRYPLRGLERSQCPECGRPFTPGDQSTYIAHEWQRRAQRPKSISIRNPRFLQQRLLDSRANAGTWRTIALCSVIGFMLMYGLFVLMFGPIEDPVWNWCHWIPPGAGKSSP